MITYEFHVTRSSRIKYGFDKNLFTISGDLVVANFYQARLLTEKINSVRKNEGKSDHLVTAGLVNALGLIHEIYHYLIRLYEETENPGALSRAVRHLHIHLSEKELNHVLLKFVTDFPPLDVFKGSITPEDYLNSSTEGKPNSEIILEELIILHLENSNPAAAKLEELYSDKDISQKSKYIELVDGTEQFFITEKPFGSENLPLFQFLRKPIIASPYSIDGQLDFIRENWGIYVYEKFNERLLKGKDLILEDMKLFITHFGKGTPPVPQYKSHEEYLRMLREKLAAGLGLTEDESRFYYSEVERFTADIDWMPKVVMIAKNAFVWLDQLSKKYQREIRTLDQIPDEELDQLARWNFTALWLIGIWERSSASKKIKQLTGNQEAVSSAYSLYDYVIAKDLGGEQSFQNLKDRAWQRGIRLASDMVPNHTGIYSKWVIEKPDYFIQSHYPPFPGYSFSGPDLSEDERVEVRIEDKYYSRTDAAVVFQRRDSYTGDVKYIYHGNDGTHMPWNDTAQLNLLIPEVRESLIQTILHVARKFPIIRFDAAMTLAKKHYQRLWFPQPGTGGAIPSRSDYAMTRSQFDEAMPNEFWREVVDRINSELPDTLLLAEAFWLMEGYFVRTLGMHRVYNSAFMHMLMKEENNKYRELIKNTLDFNPEILKRYVNFMSNPDEETAVNQFGKGDKYFGICMLMVTLPGLPMFAHGQVEGFSEKYGMEYKRAYYDEFIDDNLVRRHEAEIFPLIRKRYLFSQVHDFEFFDFIDDFGNVNENVFAFTNKAGDERALVIYNNSYNECKGTLRYSVSKSDSHSRNLGSALGAKYDYGYYYICKEHRTRLEYLYSGREFHDHGIYVSLNGYEYKLFLNIYEVFDQSGMYERLYNFLSGRGVHSIDQALKELTLAPVHNIIYDILNRHTIDNFISYSLESETKEKKTTAFIENFSNEVNRLIDEINLIKNIPLDKKLITDNLLSDLNSFKSVSQFLQQELKKKNGAKLLKENTDYFKLFLETDSNEKKDFILPYILIDNLVNTINPVNNHNNSFDRLMLGKAAFDSFERLGHHYLLASEEAELIYTFVTGKAALNKFFSENKNKSSEAKKNISKKEVKKQDVFLEEILMNQTFLNYIKLHEFNGIKYYNKERLDNLIDWIFIINIIRLQNHLTSNLKIKSSGKNSKKSSAPKTTDILKKIKELYSFYNEVKIKSDKAEYKLDELKNLLKISVKIS